MNHKTSIFLILLIIMSLSGFSQITFRFGPDVGLSMTSRHVLDYSPPVKLPAFLSPLIGISGVLKVSSHMQLSSAFQYETVGFRTQDLYPEKIKFHKLIIPFTIGIILGNSKIRPVVFIGYRPNILLSGTWQEGGSPLNPSGTIHNIFNIDFSPKRYTNQFIIGFSTYFGNNLAFNLSYCAGQSIDFGYPITFTHHYAWQISTMNYMEQLKNNEFSISLTYYLKSNKTTN